MAFASSSFETETLTDVYHITAERTVYHSREKVKEAFGHVVVSSEGKRLAADYLWIDDNTKDIKARGNVLFVDKGATIEAAELHFNLDTGIGSIFYGRVYNDHYSLRGQLIRKVGEYHYLTTEGEYTTCKDCPESWKLAARNVDLTVDGYAFMDGVFLTIKDIPTVYVPYLVVPVKTKRQTGLLFPRMSWGSTHGFVFVQPLFIAIDEHQDATLSAGLYDARGVRYEAEHRYMSYNGIKGDTNIYYSRDRSYEKAEYNRGAIATKHEWPFFNNFGMRWRYYDVRDRDYIYDFGDIGFENVPYIESNALAQAPFNDFFASVEAKRYRNLLYDAPKGFDGGLVQAAPTVHLGLKERKIVGPLLGSFYSRYDNFNRRNDVFTDYNNNRIFDPDTNFNTDATGEGLYERLRETRRFMFMPELSVPFRLGSFFTMIPSVQYNYLHYSFSLPPNNTSVPSTATTYLRYKLDTNTTIERIYDYNGEKVSKVKHQITPFANFSYIPSVHNDVAHPFQRQLLKPNGLFDQFDIVPMTNSTNFMRFPQGKSVYYGIESRLIRKMRKQEEIPRAYPYDLVPATPRKKFNPPQNRKEELAQEAERIWDEAHPRYDLYDEMWILTLSQAYDFLEARSHKDDPERAFSFLLGKSRFHLDDHFTHTVEYRFFPRATFTPEKSYVPEIWKDRHEFNTSISYSWLKMENLTRTRSLNRSVSITYSDKNTPPAANVSRSVGGSLNWSINDFAQVNLANSYNIHTKQMVEWNANVILTHPSECWGLLFRYDWKRAREPKNADLGFELLLNLVGTGLMGTKNTGSGGTGLLGGT